MRREHRDIRPETYKDIETDSMLHRYRLGDKEAKTHTHAEEHTKNETEAQIYIVRDPTTKTWEPDTSTMTNTIEEISFRSGNRHKDRQDKPRNNGDIVTQ